MDCYQFIQNNGTNMFAVNEDDAESVVIEVHELMAQSKKSMMEFQFLKPRRIYKDPKTSQKSLEKHIAK